MSNSELAAKQVNLFTPITGKWIERSHNGGLIEHTNWTADQEYTKVSRWLASMHYTFKAIRQGVTLYKQPEFPVARTIAFRVRTGRHDGPVDILPVWIPMGTRWSLRGEYQEAGLKIVAFVENARWRGDNRLGRHMAEWDLNNDDMIL